MNIVVFSRSTTKHFFSGGMETQLKYLTEGLAKNGHSITVITTSYPNKNEVEAEDKILEENGVSYYYIGSTTPGLRPLTLWEKPFKAFGFLKRGVIAEGKKNYFIESQKVCEKLHKENPFDVIISQSTIGQGILKSDLLNNIPLISVIHGTIKAEIKNRYKANKTFMNWGRFVVVDLPVWTYELVTSNKKFFRKANAVVSVSEVLKGQFAQDHPKFKDKTVVIYNGVNTDKFKPGTAKEETFTMLFVGRMDREKGINVILESLFSLRQSGKNVDLVLIGGGIDIHLIEMKDQIKGLQLENEVNYLGEISNDDLPAYYQKSHVFVFPTLRQEGHPMTVSEAFCSGLPIIASSIGGLKNSVDDGKNGYLIDSGNANQLVEKVTYLYENSEVLRGMSESAHKKGIERFSQKAMIAGYEELLKTFS